MAQNAPDAALGINGYGLYINRISFRRLARSIVKEFNQIRRDRRLAISLIIPPTLQLLLFGFALNPLSPI